MSQQRTIAFWEPSPDLLSLKASGFSLQVAKTVIGKDGTLDFNVIWQSRAISPRSQVSWTPVYGLNWTTDVPNPGVQVAIGGVWQQVNPGESYDLTDTGLWVPSAAGSGKPGFLQVGNNGYQYPGVDGIHITVGIKVGEDDWNTIYVDPVTLGFKETSWYQPQEKVKFWYETGARSETMVSGAQTGVGEYNMSGPNPASGKYYASATYSRTGSPAGVWSISPNPPPSIAIMGVMGCSPSGLTGKFGSNGHGMHKHHGNGTMVGVLFHYVAFSPAITKSVQRALQASMIASLSNAISGLEIIFDGNGKLMTVKRSSPKYSEDEFHDVDDRLINDALLKAQADNVFPAHEMWNITQ